MGYMGCLSNGQFDLMWKIWENNGILLESDVICTHTKNLYLKLCKTFISKFQISALIRKGYLEREQKHGKSFLKALQDKDAYFTFINENLNTSFKWYH